MPGSPSSSYSIPYLYRVVLFDHSTLIWIYLYAIQVSVYYAEVINGGVCMNSCAHDSLGVGGGVEAGSSAAAACPAALAARISG